MGLGGKGYVAAGSLGTESGDDEAKTHPEPDQSVVNGGTIHKSEKVGGEKKMRGAKFVEDLVTFMMLGLNKEKVTKVNKGWR